MTLNCKNKYFFINKGPWAGKYLYDLYKKGTTPYSWHKKIPDYAKKKFYVLVHLLILNMLIY